MSNKLNHLAMLQAAIRQKYQCDAVHRQTIAVHEIVDGQTIWKGEVEVFELHGHAVAKKCFAWSHDLENGKGVRLVTVLERPPINSPEMAVKAAIFFEAQPVLHPHSHYLLEEVTSQDTDPPQHSGPG